MARHMSAEKKMARDIIATALVTTKRFDERDQTVTVDLVDDQTIRLRVYGKGNTLPATLTVKVTGPA